MRHWYVNVGVGVPVHVPLSAFRSSPTCALPEIVGGAVLLGFTAVRADPMPAVSANNMSAATAGRPSQRKPLMRPPWSFGFSTRCGELPETPNPPCRDALWGLLRVSAGERAKGRGRYAPSLT